MNPDIQYWLWRFEQRRHDIELERRRVYLQARRPDPVVDPTPAVSEATDAPACSDPAAA